MNSSSFNDPFDILFNANGRTMNPTNVGYNKQEMVLQVALPGYSRSDIDIDINSGRLAVNAKAQNQISAYEFTSRDINLSGYKQVWHLPKTANTDAIEATYESGILTVRIPYLQSTRESSRKITIQ